MTPAARALALLGLAASLLGCGGLLRSPDPEPGRVAELEREIVGLRQEKTVAEVELARLRQEIASLRAKLAAAEAASGTRPDTRLDMMPGAGETSTEAGAAAAETARESVAPREEPVVTEIESEDVEMEDVPPPAAATSGEAAAATPPPPEAPTGLSEEGQSLYDESYVLFNEGRYDRAEHGFRRFLEHHPTSSLADNAQFWIGESHWARGEIEAALEAFLATVERYPQGNKVPDALYKAGRCLEALGDAERAAATYEEVRNRFPNTAAAAAAAERLASPR